MAESGSWLLSLIFAWLIEVAAFANAISSCVGDILFVVRFCRARRARLRCVGTSGSPAKATPAPLQVSEGVLDQPLVIAAAVNGE
jgi:hypothetical protein